MPLREWIIRVFSAGGSGHISTGYGCSGQVVQSGISVFLDIRAVQNVPATLLILIVCVCVSVFGGVCSSMLGGLGPPSFTCTSLCLVGALLYVVGGGPLRPPMSFGSSSSCVCASSWCLYLHILRMIHFPWVKSFSGTENQTHV